MGKLTVTFLMKGKRHRGYEYLQVRSAGTQPLCLGPYGLISGSVVDGGEKGGVGADQGRVL